MTIVIQYKIHKNIRFLSNYNSLLNNLRCWYSVCHLVQGQPCPIKLPLTELQIYYLKYQYTWETLVILWYHLRYFQRRVSFWSPLDIENILFKIFRVNIKNFQTRIKKSSIDHFSKSISKFNVSMKTFTGDFVWYVKWKH